MKLQEGCCLIKSGSKLAFWILSESHVHRVPFCFCFWVLRGNEVGSAPSFLTFEESSTPKKWFYIVWPLGNQFILFSSLVKNSFKFRRAPVFSWETTTTAFALSFLGEHTKVFAWQRLRLLRGVRMAKRCWSGGRKADGNHHVLSTFVAFASSWLWEECVFFRGISWLSGMNQAPARNVVLKKWVFF